MAVPGESRGGGAICDAPTGPLPAALPAAHRGLQCFLPLTRGPEDPSGLVH